MGYRYTQVYNEYQKVLEGHIEKLVVDCECTSEEFFGALQSNRDGETQLYVEIILAAAEYENFIEMMRSYKRKLAEDAAAK